MIILGLTGSIGMGKSTTAELFRQAGTPVYDADAEVAALYAAGGGAVAAVAKAFSGAVVGGAVDRERLSALLKDRPKAFAALEAIVHPLVAARREAFLNGARAQGAAVVLLDIPLLFEVGADKDVDAVIVVTAPEPVQRERALSRPGMDPQKLDMILARQVPDAEKRRRADFLVDTSAGLEPARAAVQAILRAVTAVDWTPPRRQA